MQSFLSRALSNLWHDAIILLLSLVSVLSAIRFNFGKEWSDFYVMVHKQEIVTLSNSYCKFTNEHGISQYLLSGTNNYSSLLLFILNRFHIEKDFL